MKKSVLILFLLLILNVCNSCLPGGMNMHSGVFSNDRKIANEKFEQLIHLIQEKNKDSVKELFALNAIVDCNRFNENIDLLFQYYQGELISYNDWGGPATEGSKDADGSRKKIFYSTYDVKTTEQTYRIAIKQVVTDTQKDGNIGLWSFYIIKMEDDIHSQYAYRGDGKYTSGINIGIMMKDSLT